MQQIETLKKIIKETGVSIAKISKDSQIKQDRIYKWLKDRGNPKAEDSKLLDLWIKKQLEEIPNQLNDSGDYNEYGKYNFKVTDAEFYAFILKEMAAMKAAIKVLTLEAIETKQKGAGKLVNIKLYNRLSVVVDLVKLYPLTISNQDFNRWLKHIAVLAGITKNLTAHVGRHSFGGFLSDAGIDKEIAQQMLGHRDRKSTDIYYHIKNKRIDDAAGKLNDL